MIDVDPGAGFRVEVDGPAATVTLARPERLNSQGPVMWEALTAARDRLPDTVRVVVLRGEGRAFSAGLDRDLIAAEDGLLGIAHLPRAEATERIAAWQRAFDWSSNPDVVSIAAVQGHAIGGGFQLALGADLRIVSDDVSFRMAEPALGIVPDLGGTKRLVDLVGYSRAAELCLTARTVGAQEALALGLASRVVPREGLDAAVAGTVAALLAVDHGASAATKALLQSAHGRTQDDQETAEREAQYGRLRILAGLPPA